MKIALASAFVLTISTAAMAAEKPVPAAQLKKLVAGKQVGAMYYGADGSYTYNGGDPGKYQISNGRICVNFNSGQKRCDSIVTDGSGYTLINGRGQRFPFNP